MSFKPMLASHADLDSINFPVMCSPKLDGVRALIIKGKVYSRSLKLIPNQFVQDLFQDSRLEGLDGEMIVGYPTDPHCFSNTTSGIMKKEGTPNVTFHIFDSILNPNKPWMERFYASRLDYTFHDHIKLVPQTLVENMDELLEQEKYYLDVGYEGLMIREMMAPYKFGRSTTKEGYLLKLKRYKDSEAKVIKVNPLFTNTNEAKRNELGKLERSNCKAGMVEQPLLGTLEVEDLKTGIRFHIGSGFTEDERKYFYEHPDELENKIVKYKYFPVGVKELPRHPVFLGIRDERDMS